MLAKRARSLPYGGKLRITDPELQEVVTRTAVALGWAGEKERRIDFDRPARKRWREVYEDLTGAAEREAKFGATIERAAPTVRRLALIYAVADQSESVKTSHLNAALEVWRYCEASAEYIHADEPRPGAEGKIVRLLKKQSPEWVARKVVYRKLRNVTAYRIDSALASLDGDIESREVKTPGRPRKEYRWPPS